MQECYIIFFKFKFLATNFNFHTTINAIAVWELVSGWKLTVEILRNPRYSISLCIVSGPSLSEFGKRVCVQEMRSQPPRLNITFSVKNINRAHRILFSQTPLADF